MIDLGPHALFIIAAYLGVGLVTGGLVVAVLVNARTKARQLKALEARRRPEKRA